MRDLLASEARPSWVPVVALAGVHQVLAAVLGNPGNGTLSFDHALMPAVIGVLQLIFGVLIGPFLLALVGGWFGGQADPDEIRQSVAWSYAPFAAATLCLIPILLASRGLTGSDGAAVETTSQALQALVVLGGLLLYLLAVLWALVLQVVTLAEVQRFSILRAIGNLFVLLVPFLLLSAAL